MWIEHIPNLNNDLINVVGSGARDLLQTHFADEWRNLAALVVLIRIISTLSLNYLRYPVRSEVVDKVGRYVFPMGRILEQGCHISKGPLTRYTLHQINEVSFELWAWIWTRNKPRLPRSRRIIVEVSDTGAGGAET